MNSVLRCVGLVNPTSGFSNLRLSLEAESAIEPPRRGLPVSPPTPRRWEYDWQLKGHENTLPASADLVSVGRTIGSYDDG